MERKIGEIFEYNGEWYQCVESDSCGECSLFATECGSGTKSDLADEVLGKCSKARRSDNKPVIFKKLEKVGETYEKRVSDGTFSTFQKYRVYNSVILPKEPYIYCNFIDGTIEIEIKQTKEDMEENKKTFPKEDNALTRTVYAYVNGKISDKELIRSIKEMSDEYPYNKNNLKPFSLELAKQDKPVCTRDGRKARIICFDLKNDEYPIIAAVENDSSETLFSYTTNGEIADGIESDKDLMMCPMKRTGYINIYDNNRVCKQIFETEGKAKIAGNSTPDKYVQTIKIEWEE